MTGNPLFNRGRMPSLRSDKWANPWYSPATDFLPTTLETAWDFCLFLINQNPEFANGMLRVGSHFITDVSADESETGSRKAKTAWCEWMKEELRHNSACVEAVIDQNCYGNAFMYLAFPFDRYLIDSRNGRRDYHAVTKFREEDVRYFSNEMMYEVPDPRGGGQRVKMRFEDWKSTDRSRIRHIRLDPRRTILNCSFMGGSQDVIYMFDPLMLSDIKSGKAIYQVNDTPIEMLRAIKDNKYFKFDRGEVFHFKQPSPTGLSRNGWGIPPVLAHYRLLHNLAIYRKIDETVALDYMLPYRVMCPAERLSEIVQSNHMDFGMWNGAVRKLIDRRREDPTSMQSFPIPITMEQMGGDGKNLVTKDLISYQVDATLSAANIPVELFRGSVAVQTIPATLRFFENSHLHFKSNINSFTRWTSLRIRNYLEMPPMSVRMLAPSMADNLENKQILIQMAAGGDIPRSEPYRTLNLGNPVDMARARDQEDFAIEENRAKLRNEFMAKMQNNGSLQAAVPQAAAGGPVGAPIPQAAAVGGAGPTPEDVPVTPMDLANEADSIATDLLSKNDPANTRRMLNSLRGRNDGGTLYAAVKQKMDEKRNQAASQGRSQVGEMIQQQQQQPPPQQ